jgi:hypothetical protein
MRSFFGLLIFLAGPIYHYFWEFIRAALYDRGLHMLSPHGSPELAANYGLTLALVGVGIWLYWPTRPEVLRFHPICFFLERDSVSELMGVQTFPQISYIQVSITTSASVEKCRAWMTKAEFSPDEIVPYSSEHNERIPLIWSKHGGSSPHENDLYPGDSPVRVNVAIFHNGYLEIDGGTPTNFLPLLQREGFHRLSININGNGRLSRISESRRIIVHWHNGAASVKMDATK